MLNFSHIQEAHSVILKANEAQKKDILKCNLWQEVTTEELEWLDNLRFLIAIELLLSCYLNSRALE